MFKHLCFGFSQVFHVKEMAVASSYKLVSMLTAGNSQLQYGSFF